MLNKDQLGEAEDVFMGFSLKTLNFSRVKPVILLLITHLSLYSL